MPASRAGILSLYVKSGRNASIPQPSHQKPATENIRQLVKKAATAAPAENSSTVKSAISKTL